MARKPNISVIGSYTATESEFRLSRELGNALSNYNVNVICGGQKGVMEGVCRGAQEHPKDHKLCTVIAIMPSDQLDEGNPFLDVVIPMGSKGLQNIVIPLSGDVVIAIGGAAGTLTELGFAWQYKKPIALLGETGWSKTLANQKLDDRRTDKMVHFSDVPSVISWLIELLSLDEVSMNSSSP